jgi:hypothetical protein
MESSTATPPCRSPRITWGGQPQGRGGGHPTIWPCNRRRAIINHQHTPPYFFCRYITSTDPASDRILGYANVISKFFGRFHCGSFFWVWKKNLRCDTLHFPDFFFCCKSPFIVFNYIIFWTIMNKNKDLKKRGRPPNADEKIAATILLCSEIRARSRLSPSQIEEAFKIESTPPGNNWRRYQRGERTMSVEIRDRIARKAIENGWLKTRGLFSVDENMAYGWVLSSSSLEDAKKRAKETLKKQKELEKIRDKCVDSLNELNKTLNEIGEEYWYVSHEAYVDRHWNNQNQIDGYLLSYFPKELLSITQKISCLSFIWLEMAQNFREDLID